MGPRVCAEPFCTREAVLGPYCRTHARDEVRRTEKTIAATVRKAGLRKFEYFPQGAWADVVAVTLERIATEEHPEELERHVESLLKLLASHPDPVDKLAHSGLWGGIKRSVSTITAKLKEERVTFATLAGSPAIAETDPRVRTILHRLELYATCLAALKMKKALELLESYGTLRKTLEQRGDAKGGQAREPLGPPSTLSTSEAVRSAADYVRRYHDGERSSLVELGRGREGLDVESCPVHRAPESFVDHPDSLDTPRHPRTGTCRRDVGRCLTVSMCCPCPHRNIARAGRRPRR
jgi:hypothetical protein